MGRPTTHAVSVVVVVLVVVLVLAVGCTGDPGPGTGTQPVSTASPRTDPPATQPDLLTSDAPLSIAEAGSQRQVEAAKDLLRAQQALHRALMEPVNPDLPEFVARFTGDALARETKRITDNRDQHLAFEAPTVFRLRVESITDNDDGSMTAIACYTMKARFYHSDTGETIDDRLLSERWRYRVTSDSALWKVTAEEYFNNEVVGLKCAS